MKILIIGGSGFIGWKLVEHFSQPTHTVYFTYLKNNSFLKNGHQLDITQKDSTIQLISQINPDVVIHTAALTNVDLCQTNNQLADSIHVQGTTNIVDGCKMTKSKLIYVSTSFVFDGHKKPFFEEDEIIPTTYYGLTKAKGENLVKQSGLSYLILRTDQPYGWAKKWQHTNSVLRIIQTLGSGNEFREIVDWYNTPTYVPDFVNASARLIEQNESGIFHLVGSDYVSRYDWAMLIAESFGLDKKLIIPISSTTLNLQAKRDNVYLSNEKLYNKTGVRMMGIMGGVNEMLRTRSENDKS